MCNIKATINENEPYDRTFEIEDDIPRVPTLDINISNEDSLFAGDEEDATFAEMLQNTINEGYKDLLSSPFAAKPSTPTFNSTIKKAFGKVTPKKKKVKAKSKAKTNAEDKQEKKKSLLWIRVLK